MSEAVTEQIRQRAAELFATGRTLDQVRDQVRAEFAVRQPNQAAIDYEVADVHLDLPEAAPAPAVPTAVSPSPAAAPTAVTVGAAVSATAPKFDFGGKRLVQGAHDLSIGLAYSALASSTLPVGRAKSGRKRSAEADAPESKAKRGRGRGRGKASSSGTATTTTRKRPRTPGTEAKEPAESANETEQEEEAAAEQVAPTTLRKAKKSRPFALPVGIPPPPSPEEEEDNEEAKRTEAAPFVRPAAAAATAATESKRSLPRWMPAERNPQQEQALDAVHKLSDVQPGNLLGVLVGVLSAGAPRVWSELLPIPQPAVAPPSEEPPSVLHEDTQVQQQHQRAIRETMQEEKKKLAWNRRPAHIFNNNDTSTNKAFVEMILAAPPRVPDVNPDKLVVSTIGLGYVTALMMSESEGLQQGVLDSLRFFQQRRAPLVRTPGMRDEWSQLLSTWLWLFRPRRDHSASASLQSPHETKVRFPRPQMSQSFFLAGMNKHPVRSLDDLAYRYKDVNEPAVPHDLLYQYMRQRFGESFEKQVRQGVLWHVVRTRGDKQQGPEVTRGFLNIASPIHLAVETLATKQGIDRTLAQTVLRRLHRIFFDSPRQPGVTYFQSLEQALGAPSAPGTELMSHVRPIAKLFGPWLHQRWKKLRGTTKSMPLHKSLADRDDSETEEDRAQELKLLKQVSDWKTLEPVVKEWHADLDTVNAGGHGLLTLLILLNNCPWVEQLLDEQGIDLFRLDRYGQLPLKLALVVGTEDIWFTLWRRMQSMAWFPLEWEVYRRRFQQQNADRPDAAAATAPLLLHPSGTRDLSDLDLTQADQVTLPSLSQACWWLRDLCLLFRDVVFQADHLELAIQFDRQSVAQQLMGRNGLENRKRHDAEKENEQSEEFGLRRPFVAREYRGALRNVGEGWTLGALLAYRELWREDLEWRVQADSRFWPMSKEERQRAEASQEGDPLPPWLTSGGWWDRSPTQKDELNDVHDQAESFYHRGLWTERVPSLLPGTRRITETMVLFHAARLCIVLQTEAQKALLPRLLKQHTAIRREARNRGPQPELESIDDSLTGLLQLALACGNVRAQQLLVQEAAEMEVVPMLLAQGGLHLMSIPAVDEDREALGLLDVPRPKNARLLLFGGGNSDQDQHWWSPPLSDVPCSVSAAFHMILQRDDSFWWQNPIWKQVPDNVLARCLFMQPPGELLTAENEWTDELRHNERPITDRRVATLFRPSLAHVRQLARSSQGESFARLTRLLHGGSLLTHEPVLRQSWAELDQQVYQLWRQLFLAMRKDEASTVRQLLYAWRVRETVVYDFMAMALHFKDKQIKEQEIKVAKAIESEMTQLMAELDKTDEPTPVRRPLAKSKKAASASASAAVPTASAASASTPAVASTAKASRSHLQRQARESKVDYKEPGTDDEDEEEEEEEEDEEEEDEEEEESDSDSEEGASKKKAPKKRADRKAKLEQRIKALDTYVPPQAEDITPNVTPLTQALRLKAWDTCRCLVNPGWRFSLLRPIPIEAVSLVVERERDRLRIPASADKDAKVPAAQVNLAGLRPDRVLTSSIATTIHTAMDEIVLMGDSDASASAQPEIRPREWVLGMRLRREELERKAPQTRALAILFGSYYDIDNSVLGVSTQDLQMLQHILTTPLHSVSLALGMPIRAAQAVQDSLIAMAKARGAQALVQTQQEAALGADTALKRAQESVDTLQRIIQSATETAQRKQAASAALDKKTQLVTSSRVIAEKAHAEVKTAEENVTKLQTEAEKAAALVHEQVQAALAQPYHLLFYLLIKRDPTALNHILAPTLRSIKHSAWSESQLEDWQNTRTHLLASIVQCMCALLQSILKHHFDAYPKTANIKVRKAPQLDTRRGVLKSVSVGDVDKLQNVLDKVLAQLIEALPAHARKLELSDDEQQSLWLTALARLREAGRQPQTIPEWITYKRPLLDDLPFPDEYDSQFRLVELPRQERQTGDRTRCYAAYLEALQPNFRGQYLYVLESEAGAGSNRHYAFLMRTQNAEEVYFAGYQSLHSAIEHFQAKFRALTGLWWDSRTQPLTAASLERVPSHSYNAKEAFYQRTLTLAVPRELRRGNLRVWASFNLSRLDFREWWLMLFDDAQLKARRDHVHPYMHMQVLESLDHPSGVLLKREHGPISRPAVYETYAKDRTTVLSWTVYRDVRLAGEVFDREFETLTGVPYGKKAYNLRAYGDVSYEWMYPTNVPMAPQPADFVWRFAEIVECLTDAKQNPTDKLIFALFNDTLAGALPRLLEEAEPMQLGHAPDEASEAVVRSAAGVPAMPHYPLPPALDDQNDDNEAPEPPADLEDPLAYSSSFSIDPPLIVFPEDSKEPSAPIVASSASSAGPALSATVSSLIHALSVDTPPLAVPAPAPSAAGTNAMELLQMVLNARNSDRVRQAISKLTRDGWDATVFVNESPSQLRTEFRRVDIVALIVPDQGESHSTTYVWAVFCGRDAPGALVRGYFLGRVSFLAGKVRVRLWTLGMASFGVAPKKEEDKGPDADEETAKTFDALRFSFDDPDDFGKWQDVSQWTLELMRTYNSRPDDMAQLPPRLMHSDSSNMDYVLVGVKSLPDL